MKTEQEIKARYKEIYEHVNRFFTHDDDVYLEALRWVLE